MVGGEVRYNQGFQPQCVLQMTPPAACTALSVHTEWQLLVFLLIFIYFALCFFLERADNICIWLFINSYMNSYEEHPGFISVFL